MAAFSLLATGCATYQSSDAVQNIDLRYQAGDYALLAESIEQQLDLFDSESGELATVTPTGDVLLHLEAAESWRLVGNKARSIEHYDVIETLFKDEDTEGFGKKIAEGIGAAFVNDSVRSYEPPPAERILTNFYKALSFWSSGELDNARVEFNRANERARIAVERYQKMIEKEQAKNEEDSNSKQNLHSDGVQNALSQNFPNIEYWEVFDSFVNPAVAYINSIFLAQGPGADIEKAETLLQRVSGMVGDNAQINEDLLNLRQYGRLTIGSPQRWIIFESGLSPVYGEKKFSIPWITSNALIQVTVALPELIDRPSGMGVNGLAIDDNAVQLIPFARMDMVMRTEFKKRWPATVSRAVVSAATKAILQDQMGRKFGALGNLAGTVYANASASADTRAWHAMPEQWSLAKVPALQESSLRVPYGNGEYKEVMLPANQNTLIYIKQPTPYAAPLVELFYL
ncbi:hypothetical protein [Zhongshania aliphaticivorans]|uniref:hypothetical protein n=1 Tax=Zhongshania aliphaticivorans TaxID=1470434 RepID=UPI00132F6544|nr:hypothetical protein [Zhongshania aliphaticivorans]